MTVKCSHASSSRPSNFTYLVGKLDSLATFYQQQLDWVDKTNRVRAKVVETESDDDQLSETEIPALRPAAKPITAATLRRMHWRRQMRSLESKLNGTTRTQRRKPSRRRATVHASAGRNNGEEDILSMFRQMMGARMESCRRVQKLVAFTSRSNEKLGAASPDQAELADM
ncbi:hypothetical protein DFH09DRAFT_1129599 [Mycena vulgaris]|nr:hypothetical protein DFH09DRAFT_1129599 [Mycena vulgaris]